MIGGVCYHQEDLTVKLAAAGCGEEFKFIFELKYLVLKFSVYVENWYFRYTLFHYEQRDFVTHSLTTVRINLHLLFAIAFIN
jgi:hypothetical protein